VVALTVTASLTDEASMEHPDAISPVTQHSRLAGDLSVDLPPYTVAVAEIRSD